MIDQMKITNYGRTRQQLEEFLLFCVSVPGKNAYTTAKGLEKFLNKLHILVELSSFDPFLALRRAMKQDLNLPTLLQESGMGCYNLRARTYRVLVQKGYNLFSCTADELERVPGIGYKTSRFFILHSRKDARVACIDRHIRKWLEGRGHVVKSWPMSKKEYLRIEELFLAEADALKIGPAELDLKIWREASDWEIMSEKAGVIIH